MNQPARHVVTVGNGMSGARFAEEVARRDPEGRRVRLTVLGAEEEPAYNRVLLPGIVAGTYDPADVRLPRPGHPATTVRTGAAVRSLDLGDRAVVLEDGTRVGYDDLVLATGARAAFPPVAGLVSEDGAPAAGVSPLRDMADCRRVAALVRPGAPAVVLGGGVLGLETARALAERGMRVSVVESAPWIMSRQVDAEAAGILTASYARIGVAIHAGRGAVRWWPGSGLELDDGRTLAGDLLVVTAGTRGNTGLAADAGIATDHGVLVDDTLTTSAPRVHAVGDCAQHPGGGAGLVQPGWEQAAVLADLITGVAPGSRYTGTRPVTRLKAEGVELTSLGEANADPGTTDTVTVSDPYGGRYARLAVRAGRVAGAVLLGFPEAVPEVSRLYDTGEPVPEDRLTLLRDGRPAGREEPEEGAAPLVCRCNAVTRERIEAAWLDGARTREAVAERTRATTGCGSCIRDVDALLSGWRLEPSR
ncbi:assimilatory nitrate reductase electron transfer subunit [Haloactinospora alba]|uniref:Assimilatory nitrate reductase electron transfer subunit n=1 Tax=Haloactinospora alba TaxID=405555 RepID=A0A543N902_9ACTN|nr:FAD-dependent oxidoreductase [Haloactinospora alba]TQN28288.1 assimilatory nitrate reductase electron transfer subunit [Haloactinospora alba]